MALRVAFADFSAAPWQSFEKSECGPNNSSLFLPQAAVVVVAVRVLYRPPQKNPQTKWSGDRGGALSTALELIGSAALTALALFVSYAEAVHLKSIDILDSRVIIGMLIGGMLPFLFSAMTMSSVSRAAYQMIEEVRRQFKTMPGIMKGTEKPDYKSCVAISTTAALKEMLVPGVMAVLAPLVVGILLGPSALGGLLAGALVTGVMMAIFMSNAGGAWDNAKKYIEDGNHGGKGSEAHKAAVVGDTVGDPFKDTSGPSINILIKLMTVVSLVFAPLFLSIGGLL